MTATDDIPKIIPKVVTDGDKLFFGFIYPQATVPYPKVKNDKELNDHVLQGLHSLCVVRSWQLLDYARRMKPDDKIEVSSITSVSN